MKKTYNNILCIAMLAFLVGMGAWLLLKTPEEYSYTERRTLAKDKTFSTERFLNGIFMNDFEDYALDQFPFRETFRSVKAVTEHYVFHKEDSNQIYLKDGYLSKLEYPLNDAMIDRSIERINYIYDKYLKDTKIKPYFVIVPDKNYYLADQYNLLSMDYPALYERMLTATDYMKYIELNDLLERSDYYFTDTHWRQENLQDVALRISHAMGTPLKAQYDTVTLDTPFNGVYVGQSALPVKPDTLKYLNNSMLDHSIVTSYDTGIPVKKSVYDLGKATSKDPYEVFLTGATAMLTIENPEASTDKELVIFRDSFGSSLAPLFVEGYKKITLIDLRYIHRDMIGAFVDFDEQDVLFMYSTLILNNGLGGGN